MCGSEGGGGRSVRGCDSECICMDVWRGSEVCGEITTSEENVIMCNYRLMDHDVEDNCKALSFAVVFPIENIFCCISREVCEGVVETFF